MVRLIIHIYFIRGGMYLGEEGKKMEANWEEQVMLQ